MKQLTDGTQVQVRNLGEGEILPPEHKKTATRASVEHDDMYMAALQMRLNEKMRRQYEAMVKALQVINIDFF